MKILICATMLLMAGPAAAADMSATQQKLVDMEAAWSKAMVAKDTAAVSSIVGDDWTGQNPGGKMEDKTNLIADIKSGTAVATEMTNHDVHVRVMGNMAVVQGADNEKSSYKDKDTSGAYTWMDVFAKRDGKWVAIASQVTKTAP
ncbi:MAG TPA: nuclear transport factor 2 family protein [Rhizomicrobium sp.]|nr:nuclear transport factor 2 family protein [Rhizomicrobium sp.]